MFALATIDVVLELSFLFWFVVKGKNVPEANLHFKSLIYITSKYVAVFLLGCSEHSIYFRSVIADSLVVCFALNLSFLV